MITLNQLTYRSYCLVLKLWWNDDDISVDRLVKGSKVSGTHPLFILLPVLWHPCSHLMVKCFAIFGEFEKINCMFEGETRDRSKRCGWSFQCLFLHVSSAGKGVLEMKSSTKQGDDNLFPKECEQDRWSCVGTPWLTDHLFSEAKHTFLSSHSFAHNSRM